MRSTLRRRRCEPNRISVTPGPGPRYRGWLSDRQSRCLPYQLQTGQGSGERWAFPPQRRGAARVQVSRRGWLLQRAEGLTRLAHAFAVGRVGLGAVLYVLFDGLVPGALDGASGVVEAPLLLVAGHESEQVTGLLEVVVVVFAEIEVIGGGPDRLGGIGVGGLFSPAAEVVGLDTRDSTLVAVDAHGPVAVIGVDQLGCTWVVDRDLVVVDAHPVAGCVSVGEQPALQHLVRIKRDSMDKFARS